MKCTNKKILILSLSMITILASVGEVNALEVKNNSNLEKQTIKETVVPELVGLTMQEAFPDKNFRKCISDILVIQDDGKRIITEEMKTTIENTTIL
ncbi:Uncharacterised protein [Clostridioides difficile]|nr:Uncharacterised protein [Clostridioides difficile]